MTHGDVFVLDLPAGKRLIGEPRLHPGTKGWTLIARDAERGTLDLWLTRYEPVSDGTTLIEAPWLGAGVLRPATEEDLREMLAEPTFETARAILDNPYSWKLASR